MISKENDIVYTSKEYRWHDIKSSEWHQVPANTAFRIDNFCYDCGKPYVRLFNIKEHYKILMSAQHFHERFEIRQIRKKKLEELKKYESNL